jgi:2-dehydropantoate 2-reductase
VVFLQNKKCEYLGSRVEEVLKVGQVFPRIKKICVYGLGGVGGYFGGKMAETINNKFKEYEIYFIARGEHLRVIKREGIKVETPERVITGVPTMATDEVKEINSPDLFLLCVKSYDLAAAVSAIKPMVTGATLIMPLCNGVDIYERIRAGLNNGFVLPACVYLGTHIEKPGMINQNGGSGVILSGPDPRYPRFSGETVKIFFQEMGVSFQWNSDPYPAIWEKYIFIAAFGLVSASSGKTLGEIMDNTDLINKVKTIMQEIVEIARKKSVTLPEDIVERSLKKAFNFPYEAKTSYQRDVEISGKPNEGDLFGGTIIREGASLGIATAITQQAYKTLQK